MGYIAGIGAANVDIRGRSERKLIMGDSNPGTLYTTLGGVCRNICENLARLGSNVKLVTVVGDDENGRSILRGCEAAGIDMSHTHVLEGERSSSYISLRRRLPGLRRFAWRRCIWIRYPAHGRRRLRRISAISTR